MERLLRRFREIVLADTEFVEKPGEPFIPVCLAFHELRSGRRAALWADEFETAPPHAHDPDTLYVSFTGAEPEFYRLIGWPFATPLLDLRAEHVNLVNLSLPREERKKLPKPPKSLIEILHANGIKDGDADLKNAMVARIMQGAPYTAAERQTILDYCADDVQLLKQLLEILLPRIKHLDQALMRGEYVKLMAEVLRRGIPADPWAGALLKRPEIRQALRLRAVSDQSLSHGLYTGRTLDQAKLQEFVVRNSSRWRRTKTGKWGTKDRDFDKLAELHPEFEGLADVVKTVKQLKEFELFAGPDDRYRTPIWPLSTITGRAAPKGARYPFTTPAWTRNTIVAPPGLALAYLDIHAMEFGTASALSQCRAMQEDYLAEPYLVLPIRAGLLPPGATKRSHPVERDRYKPKILAIQYGAGAGLLERGLNLSRGQASRVVDLHKERYADYWDYSDRRLQWAHADGEIVTPDGWRCAVNSRTSTFTLRNWIIQATSAAVFRYAGLLMRGLDPPIKICAVVHDAVLIEAEENVIELEIARATQCLERAARRLLHGFTLHVGEPKILRPGERFTDPRGVKTWAFVENSLRELERGRLSDAAD